MLKFSPEDGFSAQMYVIQGGII